MEQGLDAFLVESRLLHAKTHRSSKRPAKMHSPFPTEGAPCEPSTLSTREYAPSAATSSDAESATAKASPAVTSVSASHSELLRLPATTSSHASPAESSQVAHVAAHPTISDRGTADSRNRPTIVGVGLSPDSGRRDSSSSVAADGLRVLRRLLGDRLSVSEADETRTLSPREHVG